MRHSENLFRLLSVVNNDLLALFERHEKTGQKQRLYRNADDFVYNFGVEDGIKVLRLNIKMAFTLYAANLTKPLIDYSQVLKDIRESEKLKAVWLVNKRKVYSLSWKSPNLPLRERRSVLVTVFNKTELEKQNMFLFNDWDLHEKIVEV